MLILFFAERPREKFETPWDKTWELGEKRTDLEQTPVDLGKAFFDFGKNTSRPRESFPRILENFAKLFVFRDPTLGKSDLCRTS